MKVYRQWVPCKCNSIYNFILIFMQLCTSFFHGLKMCLWFGFNPGVNFYHFSTLLTLSFFKFSQVRHQLHQSLIFLGKELHDFEAVGPVRHCHTHNTPVVNTGLAGPGSSIRCASAWHANSRECDPRVWQHSFMKIGRAAILSTLLFQAGQLSVTGERMCH